MEQEKQTPTFDRINELATAVERIRVLSTPTAIHTAKQMLLCSENPTKRDVILSGLLENRSVRRTIRRMAKVGLIRYEPWKPQSQIYLTSTAKKILRAAGFRV